MNPELPQDKKKLRSLVNEIYNEALAEAQERIWSHRFTKDLETGTLPFEVVQGLHLNVSTWAMEINTSARGRFGYHFDFYARHPDLEDLLADKAADEFTTPTPPGHQPTIYRLGAALGLTRERMIYFHLIPATRGYLDFLVWLFATGSPGGISITEEFYADWAKTWSKALQKHYGLTKEDVFYWDLHGEADSLADHDASHIQQEVMGHAMANRYLSWRLLQEGIGAAPNLRERWLYIARKTVDMYLIWLDSIYDNYDSRSEIPDRFEEKDYADGKTTDPNAWVEEFLTRGQELAERLILKHPFVRALSEGELPLKAVISFHEQWYRIVRRITADSVGQYHHFVHIYKVHQDLEAQIARRIGNEVERPVPAGRPRAYTRLLKALGSSPEQALKSEMSIEANFLVAFLGRLSREGTFAETNALQLGNVIAPFARLCRDSLIRHYGVALEDCLYWDGYAQHDTAEEGGGALGTVEENRFALTRIYEDGLLTERPGWGVKYVGDVSIHLWKMFFTGCQRELNQ